MSAIGNDDRLRRVLNGPTMGSRWSAIFWAPAALDTTILHRDLQAAVEGVEEQMSTWRPDSDLERLNRAPIGTWVAIGAELVEVLDAALEIGRLSDGAFDVGVGDLVRAWGFGGGRTTPDAAAVARIGGRPSFDPPRTLDLDRTNRRARRLAEMAIDLSGIAKGFGVDELAATMRRHGLDAFLVGIDGEMRAAGAKPDGRLWAIGHERPDREARALLGVLELDDKAVATSGNYRHVVEVAGRNLSHTMDPQTGAPVDNDLASVTVVAERCMIADAWATALMVAGSHRALALAHRHGLATVMVRTDGEVLSTLPPHRLDATAPAAAPKASATAASTAPARP